jgi:hypothetical protein
VRASLEKEQKAKNVTPKAESQKPHANHQAVEQPLSPPLSPASTTAESPPDPPSNTPEAQFTQEELPADFWGSDSAPPPASSHDDEAFETATSTPTSAARAAPKTNAKLPFEMPLFNELQALFPGRIVRVDIKQQKQAEESEESTEPANEAVSVVESEENE